MARYGRRMSAKSRVSRDEAERLAAEWLRRTGPRLRRWRVFANQTQTEVAYNADVSVDSLRSYESGRRKPLATVLVKAAAIMGITLQDLLFTDPPPAANDCPPGKAKRRGR